MIAEEYLSSYGIKKRIVEDYIDNLNSLKASAYSCPSGSFFEYSKGNNPSDRVGRLSVKIAITEEFVQKKVIELEQLKQQMLSFINELKNDNQKTILIQRYIEGKTMAEINEEHGHSRKYWYLLHTKAVNALSDILKTA